MKKGMALNINLNNLGSATHNDYKSRHSSSRQADSCDKNV